jgi:hypothetical protein
MRFWRSENILSHSTTYTTDVSLKIYLLQTRQSTFKRGVKINVFTKHWNSRYLLPPIVNVSDYNHDLSTKSYRVIWFCCFGTCYHALLYTGRSTHLPDYMVLHPTKTSFRSTIHRPVETQISHTQTLKFSWQINLTMTSYLKVPPASTLLRGWQNVMCSTLRYLSCHLYQRTKQFL